MGYEIFMTKREFENMKIGTVVSNRFEKEKYYVILDLDIMGGNSHVYGAKEIDNERNMIRIDASNCQFWHIEGYVEI